MNVYTTVSELEKSTRDLIIKMKCECCSGNFSLNSKVWKVQSIINRTYVTCEYCDTRYMIGFECRVQVLKLFKMKNQ